MTSYQEKFCYYDDEIVKINTNTIPKDMVIKTFKFENRIKIVLTILMWISLIVGISFGVLYFLHLNFGEKFGPCVISSISIFLLIGFAIFGIWGGRTRKLLNKEAGIKIDNFGTSTTLFIFFMIPLVNILVPYRFIRDTLKIFLGIDKNKTTMISDGYQTGIVLFQVPLFLLFVLLGKLLNDGTIYTNYHDYSIYFFILLCFYTILYSIKSCINLIIEEHKKWL